MADDIQLDADGYIIKRDAHDLGAPMRPAPAGWVYRGPENAWSPNTRGDYANVTQPRVHYRRGRRNVFGEYVVNGRGEARYG